MRELDIHPFKIANAGRGFQHGPDAIHGPCFGAPGQVFLILRPGVPALIDHEVARLVHVVIDIEPLAPILGPGIAQIVFHKGFDIIHGLRFDLHFKEYDDAHCGSLHSYGLMEMARHHAGQSVRSY